MNKIDDPRVFEALRILKVATQLDPGDPDTVAAKLRRLLRWTPESAPKQFSKRSGMGYEKGDEEAPFFSEAYLYVLLGKEDARTLLALLSHLCDSIGFDWRATRALQNGPETPARLLILTGPLRGQVLVCGDWDGRSQLKQQLLWSANVDSHCLSDDEDPATLVLKRGEKVVWKRGEVLPGEI